MRPLVIMLLLLPTTLMAAETLSNSKLDKAYIAQESDCEPKKGKKLPKGCQSGQGSRAVTNKALRDAEQQNTNRALSNPKLNNPDLDPLPAQLPPPTIQQQNYQHFLDTLKNQPSPAP